jgi:dTDP-4-amino-4,6-dideoxygalactose transaminase
MINFNNPPFVGNELQYIEKAVSNNKICGDGEFTRGCNKWIENKFNITKALLTTSCTHALEMSSILVDIKEGDEVIMPSYTFVSTANAFVMRGAKIVFVDIRPDTMNLNEQLIEDAITERTRVIVPVHYAGVACEMDKILEIANKYNLLVVEDAAQGVMSTYKGQSLGTMGDFGCYSFHETKNYSMGEGGAILIKNEKYIERAEIIREKGTDRSKFFRGQVDKYTWVDFGSSYLPSELNAAYLYAQLESADDINNNRLKNWQLYNETLEILENQGFLERPYIPNECEHNAHMYYIKVKDIEQRTSLITYLKKNGILYFIMFHCIHPQQD